MKPRESGPMTKELLSVDDLSEYLNIKKSTVYSLVENGELPYYRIGRLIRCKRSDVDAWMETHRVKESVGKEKTKRTAKSVSKSKTDIDRIIRNAIDESTGLKYNANLGNRVESSTQKGGDHGHL